MSDLVPTTDAEILLAIQQAFEEKATAISKRQEVPRISLDEAQMQEFMYACIQAMAENIVFCGDSSLKLSVTIEVMEKLKKSGWKASLVQKAMSSLWAMADHMSWDLANEEEEGA